MVRNQASPGPETSRVQSVHRALQLLKLLAAEQHLTVSEAANGLDVNPSTAQRLLATLAAEGFAVQDRSRRYSAGPELVRAGQTQVGQPVQVKLRPNLEHLYTRVEETVHLASLVGTQVLHLDGIEASSRALRFGLRTGVVLPAHVTSAGKAMLADLPYAEIERRYLAEPSTPSKSPATAANVEHVLQEVAATRREGLAMNFGDSEEGVAAFSRSLGVVNGQHLAFSIAMPSARFTRELIDPFRTYLSRTVAEFWESAAADTASDDG